MQPSIDYSFQTRLPITQPPRDAQGAASTGNWLRRCLSRLAAKQWPLVAVARRLIGLFALLALIHGCSSTGPAVDAGPAPTQQQPLSGEMASKDQVRYNSAVESLEEQTEQTISVLEKLTADYPGRIELWINLATAYYRTANYDKAAEALDRAESIGELAETNNLRGLVAVKRHAYQDAATAFQEALRLNNDYADAHYNLALVYDLYLQDLSKAVDHYRHYLDRVPEDSDTAAWVEQLKHTLNKR